MCRRGWWVRPLSGQRSTRVTSPYFVDAACATGRQRVLDGFPSSSTSMTWSSPASGSLPATTARYRFVTRRFWKLELSSRSACAVLATMSSPVMGASMRCACCGCARGCAAVSRLGCSLATSSALRDGPLPPMTAMPAGLYTMAKLSSSKMTEKGLAAGAATVTPGGLVEGPGGVVNAFGVVEAIRVSGADIAGAYHAGGFFAGASLGAGRPAGTGALAAGSDAGFSSAMSLRRRPLCEVTHLWHRPISPLAS